MTPQHDAKDRAMASAFPSTVNNPPATSAPLSAGHAVIDEDHRQLDDLAGRFRQAVEASNLPLAMHLFETLLSGLQAHFKREEGLLIAASAPERHDHMTVHEDVMRELLTIRQDSFRVLRCWPERAVDLLGHLLRRSQADDRLSAESFVHGGSLPPLAEVFPQ